MALRARRAIGGVGNILGYHRHVPFLEGKGFPKDFYKTTVRVTDADLQAVVEVQPATGYIGNLPVVAG